MADTAPKPTHDEWQSAVSHLAVSCGWSYLHVRKSIAKGGRWATTTNVVGWPDLFLWHPIRGFAAIECKVKPDKPTKEQLAVLEELAGAGARTMVAYHGDLPAVSKFLRGVNSLR